MLPGGAAAEVDPGHHHVPGLYLMDKVLVDVLHAVGGQLLVECPAASGGISDGDQVAVDFDTGVITNVTKHETYQAEPFPPFIKDMIDR